MDSGFIKLFRKFRDWEWYKDHNVKSLYLHLLLTANYTDKKWKGIEIKRGQVLTSLKSLEYELGLKPQQIRTAENKLKRTSEITVKSTNKYRIITVLKYDEYQVTNKQGNKQLTNEKQSNNNQVTTTNNEKKEKKERIKEKYYDGVELNDLFLSFLKQRKQLKAINSELAIKGLLNKLEPFEDNVKYVMINESIISSWKSVFPLKKEKLDHYKKVLPKDIESDWLDDYINSL